MKALVYRGPWDIGVQEVPTPVPAPESAMLEVVATGICGSDIHGYTGRTGRRQPGQIMGHETAARIRTLPDGAAAAGLHVGQLVAVNPVIGCGQCERCQADEAHACPSRKVIGVNPEIPSAFAEYLVAPAANLVPLAGSVTEMGGALVEPLAVGYHAAVRGGCRPSDRVVVIGGGPIGQACAIAVRRMGAQVIVSEPNPTRRGLLERLGFSSVIDPGPDSAALVEAGDGRVTLVLDAVGSADSLRTATQVSQAQGRIVVVGMQAPRLELDAYAISTAERQLIGSFSYSAEEFRQTAGWLADNPELDEQLVDAQVGWSDAPEAFRSLAAGESTASKIVFVPGKD
jgi:threonine dehydrogenase-like Zn-dependent dehydrogenase